MFFKTVVLLTANLTLLIKGEAPAVWPVILIVVSSAWFPSAKWAKTMTTATTTISEHIFIGINFEIFPDKAVREFQKRVLESSKNLDEGQFLRTSVHSIPECRLRLAVC